MTADTKSNKFATHPRFVTNRTKARRVQSRSLKARSTGSASLPSRGTQLVTIMLAQRAAIAAALSMTRGPVGLLAETLKVPERFYGDGSPQWQRGRSDLPCETATQAKHEWYRTIKHLRGNQADETLFGQLADLIEACCAKARCRSGACPLCRRALQRWFVWTAPTATRKHGGDEHGRWVRISIIPSVRIRGGRNKLHLRRQLRAAIKELLAGVERAHLTIVIGGIDVSFNRHATGAFQDHYQFHLWCLVPYSMGQQARPPLEAIFPANDIAKHATYVGQKTYDGSLRGYGYALKTDFKARTTLPKEMTPAGKRPSQNTRLDDLTIAQRLPLFVMLHMLGLEGRLFLQGAKVRLNNKGVPTIRATR